MSDIVSPVAERHGPSVGWHDRKVLALGAIAVVVIAVAAWSARSDDLVTAKDGHLPAWLFLVLLGLAAAVTLLLGWVLTGFWSGALIDPTKGRMSLSRLQAILWTIIVIPAFLSAALINLSQKKLDDKNNKGKPEAQQVVIKDPLDVTIPGELLAAMGLSLGSAFVSRLVLVKKADEDKKADQTAVNDPNVATAPKSVFIADRPQWRDLFRGDTVESRNLLDIGKVQLFFITAAILIGYAAVVANAFASTGPHGITELPVLSTTVVGLLAISHAGYLTNKTTQ